MRRATAMTAAAAAAVTTQYANRGTRVYSNRISTRPPATSARRVRLFARQNEAVAEMLVKLGKFDARPGAKL